MATALNRFFCSLVRQHNLASALVIPSLLTVWGTIWGVDGAVLSAPIAACPLIVFGHIPATRPIANLMSGTGLGGR